MCHETEMCRDLVDALNQYHELAGKVQRLAKAELPRLQEALHAARRGDKQHIVDAYLTDAMAAIDALAKHAEYMTKKR